MTTMIWVYLGYLAVCIFVTLFVARTLSNHGPVFMSGKNTNVSPLIKAKTHLLVVGFYLIAFGFIGCALKYGGNVNDPTAAIELLSAKIGAIVLAIGFMHFVMVWVFACIRTDEPKKTSPVAIIDS